ncbi:sensor histidine kinase [Phormidesmis priestleyi]|uniref:sensor histidine kinase n=1 Tax=Phormidesmis priestleyi TaxID=268141 RepID=UPI00083ACB95|nr:HAMP domain-containing sensor histidine kinase [Phormidesmis priestleyi]
MRRLNQGPNTRVSNRQTFLDPASLQFRLMASVVGICAIALIAYKAFSQWEVQMLLMMHPEHLTSTQWIAIVDRLTGLTLVSMSVMMIAVLGAIWQYLQPLHQFKQWVAASTTNDSPERFNARYAPSEIRVLAHHWNNTLAQQAAVKHQQRQFISNVAHELRSPLSLVHGYLQRTSKRNQTLSEAQQESLAMATAEAERITLILQDLIDLARAESLDITLSQEPLILNEVVRDIASMTEKFDHRTIETKITPFPIRVQTNRDYLMQVIDHLIQNAIRYSDRDTSILIEVTQVNDSAIIQVCDRGDGIPQSQQALVFEPFHRIDPSRARATGGTGLGLAIVKTLIEKMGGTISLDSHPGAGTIFTLTLPTLETQL